MIKEFQGEYRWLSNFTPCKIIINDVVYPSVEHAYMSCKSDDIKWKNLCADSSNKPGLIKKLSKDIDLVENWDNIKLEVMTSCLIQKYNQQPYKNLLISTGNQTIVEGNKWNDKYWGVCLKTGIGENNLGKIIMSIRKTLIEKTLL